MTTGPWSHGGGSQGLLSRLRATTTKTGQSPSGGGDYVQCVGGLIETHVGRHSEPRAAERGGDVRGQLAGDLLTHPLRDHRAHQIQPLAVHSTSSTGTAL